MKRTPAAKRKTSPRQAGSARSLDRWQRVLEESLAYLNEHTGKTPRCGPCAARRLLAGLLASVKKAERR